MYAEIMSDNKIKYPPRLSVPLTAERRRELIDIKGALQKEDRTLTEFVWEAIVEKWTKERGKKK